uniref:Metalloendopeptidase n=1 Tax=Denticeps clupeoides TaxID=299321 RepID=A0AAY4AL47_9TELE
MKVSSITKTKYTHSFFPAYYKNIRLIKILHHFSTGLHLLEGDIMKTRKKRSIRGTNYTWDLPVPYEFGLTLDMNAKGVILRAFEQFRLKTCVDFKPHSSEDYYIYLLKMKGCWSSVGKQYTKEQFISIGHNCDNTAVVEHEFLHALGFWHEQSRYDRDEYVTITWENIEAGEEKNFEIKTNTTNSTLGTPYDYNSVLHYDKNAFSNGNGSTIITNQPEFQEVIGQRRDMSHLDVLELNHLYGCNESISFLDHCSFDKDLCQMSLCSGNSEGWKRVIRADGGPNSDHTYLGKKPQGRSLFMHFSTLTGKVGDSARLETRKITPKRSCHTQCLQFFYYHSGGRTDQLNIWIREFSNDSDYIGTIRLMDQIKGLPTNYWKVHHVPLDARKTFQVVFEAQKGTTSSRGGFSVDDINLTETDCPHETWQIRNFEEVLNNSPNDTYLYSPKYYSPDGYRYQIILRLSVDHFGIFVRLVSGFNDASLQWPCPWRQVTISLLDQNAHIQQQMTKQRSVTTDPHWLLSGEFNTYTVFLRSLLQCYGSFMMSTELREREFLKGGDIFLLITMQGNANVLMQKKSLLCITHASSLI